jgi:hypothetical protein
MKEMMMAISLSDAIYTLKTKDVNRLLKDRAYQNDENNSFYITEGMYTLPEDMTNHEYLVKRKMLTEDEIDFYEDFWDDDEIEVYVTDEGFVFERWMIAGIQEYIAPVMEVKEIIDML